MALFLSQKGVYRINFLRTGFCLNFIQPLLSLLKSRLYLIVSNCVNVGPSLSSHFLIIHNFQAIPLPFWAIDWRVSPGRCFLQMCGMWCQTLQKHPFYSDRTETWNFFPPFFAKTIQSGHTSLLGKNSRVRQNPIIHGLLGEHLPPFYLQDSMCEFMQTGEGGWTSSLLLSLGNRLPSIGHNQSTVKTAITIFHVPQSCLLLKLLCTSC